MGEFGDRKWMVFRMKILILKFRVTTNPFNTNLTSGGSSGGEGALIGFRGSCLGIGTDIGGSIRSPAANNGTYAPSS